MKREVKEHVASKACEFIDSLRDRYTLRYLAQALGMPHSMLSFVRNPDYHSHIKEEYWEIFKMISNKRIYVVNDHFLKVVGIDDLQYKSHTYDLDDPDLEFPLVGSMKAEKKASPDDKRKAMTPGDIDERLMEYLEKAGDIEDLKEPKKESGPSEQLNRMDYRLKLLLEIIEDVIGRLDRIEDMVGKFDLEKVLANGDLYSEMTVRYRKKQ